MSERRKLPTIGPLLWYRDPIAAIAWLEKAFGFETRMVVEDGQGGVAEVHGPGAGMAFEGVRDLGKDLVAGGQHRQGRNVLMKIFLR